MAEVAGNRMRALVRTESPDVYRAAGVWVLHRKIPRRHGDVHRRWVRIKVLADQGIVSESGCHQQVGLAAACREQPRDVLSLAYRILRRCRFVIHVTRIDVRSSIEQQSSSLDVRGNVK